MPTQRRKEVNDDPKSFQGEFSFVNKNASNIDSKDHNAAVSWHVMNRYERWKKQEDAKRLRASVNFPRGPKQRAANDSAVSTRSHELPDIQDGPSRVDSEDDSANIAYPPSPWEVEAIELSMLDSLNTHTSYSWSQDPLYTQASRDFLYMPPSGDPERSLELDQQMAAMRTNDMPPLITHILSYAYGVIIPTAWPNEFGRARWIHEMFCSWEDVTSIQQDPCYASTLLCFFATLMAAATNDKNVASQACFFQVQAMSELRQKLSSSSDAVDELTLKAILRLFSAETTLDNTAAARLHLKMLRNLVGARGGIMTLNPWFRENLLAADSYFALKYETRPLFSTSEWTPGPLARPWRTQLAHSGQSCDHLDGVNPGIQHANLRSIISDLRELFRVENYTKDHEISCDDHILRWGQLRKYDCISRLADHQLSVKIYSHLYTRPKLQLAICTTIALMTAMVLGSPEPVRTGMKLLADLRVKVDEARAESGATQEEDRRVTSRDRERTILWMLYVSRIAEQVHPVTQASMWSKTQLDKLAVQLGLSTAKSQSDVFRGFLFSTALEQEIQNRRARRLSEPRKGVYEACGMSWREPLGPVG